MINKMMSAGIIPHNKNFHIEKTGKIQRFRIDGDRSGSLNGWAWLESDGVADWGAFGNWKTGETYSYCSRDESDLDQDQLARKREAIERARAARDAEIKMMHGLAAKRANEILNNADNTILTHNYLRKKQIQKHDTMIGVFPRYSDDGSVWRVEKGCLLIPMINNKGKIVNVQAILSEKPSSYVTDKLFMRGGQKKSAFHVIHGSNTDKVILCEGFATGATINECTGYTVVVAFDAGNLAPVYAIVREMFHGSKITICADNDQYGEKNTGLDAARAISGADVVYPVFKDTSTNPTDFNDLFILEGKYAVQDTITPPTPAEQPQTPINACVSDNAWHDINDKGKPLGTYENFTIMMQTLNFRARYNIIKKSHEVDYNGSKLSSMDNRDESAMAMIVSAMVRNKLPTANLATYLTALSDKHRYNPVADWIESSKWDGENRLTDFFKTIIPLDQDDHTFNSVLILRWMIGAVAALYEPSGIKMKGILTLVGKQSAGKTAWFTSLAPKSLGAIKDGVTLDLKNKDSILLALRHWLVELGEVDSTFKKSEISELKSFTTQDSDSIRLPYARTESHMARRTVFLASVNDDLYLSDKTGNTRFWTIAVDSINYSHGIDVQQVWAQIKEQFYDKGQKWWLTDAEAVELDKRNAQFTKIDPLEEMVDAGFFWDQAAPFTNKMTATEIAQYLTTVADKSKTNAIASYLTKQCVRREKGKRKAFFMPEKRQ